MPRLPGLGEGSGGPTGGCQRGPARIAVTAGGCSAALSLRRGCASPGRGAMSRACALVTMLLDTHVFGDHLRDARRSQEAGGAAGRRPPRGSGAAGTAWVAAASAARPRARVWVPVFQRLPEDRERAGRPHGASSLRSSPGSALAVLRLPAGAGTAVRQLQSVSDGPVRAAAAALRLRAGKAPGRPLGPATRFLCGHEERGGAQLAPRVPSSISSLSL